MDARSRALRFGYRSGLEEKVARELKQSRVAFSFESLKIFYEMPSKKRRYTPDFVLANGVIVETKGRFTSEDRQKHLLIKQQHPDLDIRFVFSNPNTRIAKGSPTTYANWCDKHGFQYAKASVPKSWLR